MDFDVFCILGPGCLPKTFNEYWLISIEGMNDIYGVHGLAYSMTDLWQGVIFYQETILASTSYDLCTIIDWRNKNTKLRIIEHYRVRSWVSCRLSLVFLITFWSNCNSYLPFANVETETHITILASKVTARKGVSGFKLRKSDSRLHTLNHYSSLFFLLRKWNLSRFLI